MSIVKDIMTTNVLTAKTDTPFNEVVKVFTNSKINHLPITNSDGTLRAIISSTDVLAAIHEMDQFALNYNGYSLEKRLSVRDEMSSDVISIYDDAPIKHVVRLMIDNNIHAIPIVEEDNVIGIITSNDILKAIYAGKVKI